MFFCIVCLIVHFVSPKTSRFKHISSLPLLFVLIMVKPGKEIFLLYVLKTEIEETYQLICVHYKQAGLYTLRL